MKTNIIALLILCTIVRSNTNENCSPKKCSLIGYEHTKYQEGLSCDNSLNLHDLDEFNKSRTQKCDLSQVASLIITIKPTPNKMPIINESFHVLQIDRFLTNILVIQFKFLDIRGFDVESGVIKFNDRLEYLILDFYTDFYLFDGAGNMVRTCEDFERLNSSGFIFSGSQFLVLTILKPKNTHPICPMFFRNATLTTLKLSYLISSFYLKNTIKFINQTTKRINSSIERFELYESVGLDLDRMLLNEEIFARTSEFSFKAYLNSIQTDLFKPFVNHLKTIELNPSYALELIRKRGIAWIKSINDHLRVDLNDSDNLISNLKHRKKIIFTEEREFLSNDRIQFAYDEDFCLFTDFPFEQMVFLIVAKSGYIDVKSELSCTVLWLFRHYQNPNLIKVYRDNFLNAKLNGSNFSSCNFKYRQSLCDKINFVNSTVSFTRFDLMILTEFLVIIFKSIFSILGIVLNVIVIYILTNKKTKTVFEAKHYKYMSLNCIADISILCIESISLIYECQYPLGLYCSSIHELVWVQYLKIVLDAYFNNVFRMLANFAYIGFSLTRLSMIGKKHGKIIEFMDKVSIFRYMSVSLIISLSISVVKPIRYDINLDEPNLSFPIPFDQNKHKYEWLSGAGFAAILVFDFIYDLLNYLVFVLINLVLDIVLVVKLYQVLREKEEEKAKQVNEKALEKSKQENDESKRRVIFMVILNSMVNFLSRIPSTLTSLNDLRVYFSMPSIYWFDTLQAYNWFGFPGFSMEFFCSWDKSCVVFQSFGNLLYLISLSLNLFFLKTFDKNFDFAFQLKFSNHETK